MQDAGPRTTHRRRAVGDLTWFLQLKYPPPRFQKPVGVVVLFMLSLLHRTLDRPHLGPGLAWPPAADAWRRARAALVAAATAFALLAAPALAQPPPVEAPPGEYRLDPDRSSLRINLGFAGGLGATSVRFTRLDGDLTHAPGAQERARVKINVDTTSATASAWTRRSALAALEPERWPQASFVSDRISMDGDGAWTMNGRLTLRGVTRPITLHGGIAEPTGAPSADAPRLRFIGRGRIHRSEFGLPAPTLTRDQMELRFDVEFARRRPD
ncbi:YceI family protein [Phenylobacterium sp. LjRoot219]|uniref:YceI family protein n=1 Tax=Phenylobacterium sp. LjRoot219 TaxID=3342283 RepID=UPI003ED14E86